MTFNIRSASLLDINNESTIYASMVVDTGYPLFVMNDEDVKRFTYDDKTIPQVPNPKNPLTDPKYLKDTGNPRFELSCTVESPINSNRVSFYYDTLYNDVIIVPNTDYASCLPPTSKHEIITYELATGSNVNKVNDTFPTYPVVENNRHKFPKMGKLTNAKSLLLSIPGIMAVSTTQDANTFEEMINDSINLKRSQRVMLNVVELGTLKEVFPDVNGFSIPLYQYYPFAPCHYRIRPLVVVNPNNKQLYDNMKVYVNMKF